MVRRISGTAVLLLTMGLLVPSPVQGQKAPAQAPGPDIESDKLAPGVFTGKLKGAVAPGGDFELEIEYKHLELKQQKAGNSNNGNNNQIQQLLRQQQQIAQAQMQVRNAKSPQQAAQAMQSLQRAMIQMQQQAARQQQPQQQQNLFNVVTEKKEIDFHASTDLVIRRTSLPKDLAYDEKGNLKVPSAEELKALKGPDARLPGYIGRAEDLKPGAIVAVTMKRAAVDPKADPKDPTVHKNVVTLILVEQDGLDAPTKGKKKN